jgi:hypothetical protein
VLASEFFVVPHFTRWFPEHSLWSPSFSQHIQGDQKVSEHVIITIHKVTSNVQSVPLQGQGDNRLALTPSVISNSNYVIMVSVWNCLKYFCAFFFWYCNQVHRDVLINLYKTSVHFYRSLSILPFINANLLKLKRRLIKIQPSYY